MRYETELSSLLGKAAFWLTAYSRLVIFNVSVTVTTGAATVYPSTVNTSWYLPMPCSLYQMAEPFSTVTLLVTSLTPPFPSLKSTRDTLETLAEESTFPNELVISNLTCLEDERALDVSLTAGESTWLRPESACSSVATSLLNTACCTRQFLKPTLCSLVRESQAAILRQWLLRATPSTWVEIKLYLSPVEILQSFERKELTTFSLPWCLENISSVLRLSRLNPFPPPMLKSVWLNASERLSFTRWASVSSAFERPQSEAC